MAQEKTPFKYSSDSLLTKQADGERPYLPFLDNDQLSSGIYVLDAGATDQQQPHELDEIYYVLEGASKMYVESDSFDIKTGDILFVPAKAKHAFYDITKKLKLLVFFSKKQ